MKKNKEDKSPIGWYIGKSPLEGKVIKDITYIPETTVEGFTYSVNFDFTPDRNWFWQAIGDGGKKTLKVTKKEDIKFVND